MNRRNNNSCELLGASNRAQLADIKKYIEIEPEDLRESDTETDGDLVQKAFTMAEGSARRTTSIKLGRIYKVDKTIMLSNSISYQPNPHLIVKGYGGGLELTHDGFMFDGLVFGTGGIHFQNVKFIGTATYSHALFNCDNLIQIVFNGCQFAATNTILYANGFIQSGKFIGCNFKGMRTYQINAAMVYDMTIANNIVEWGAGGLINLTQPSTSQYCSIGLFITNNVLEGISEQSPIKTTHHGRCLIQGNYFEGNSYTDIDMSGALLQHRGLSIKDNSFGDYPTTVGKDSCVKVGKLYAGQGYDFSGNSGTKIIFDFTGSGGKRIVMTGGHLLYNGQPSYRGIAQTDLFYGNLDEKANSIQEEWITPTFENNWASGTSALRYLKDSFGFVCFKGFLAGTSATGGTTAFTLPVGYRPSELQYFIISSSSSAVRIAINTDGTVVPQTQTSWQCMTQIRFKAEA